MVKYLLSGMLIMAGLLIYPVIPAGAVSLRDGTYEGKHSFITVLVTVENGKIGDIAMTEHGGGGKKYADMVGPIIGKIIEKQSTDVDVVTGATVSSENLVKAVEDALEKAVPR